MKNRTLPGFAYSRHVISPALDLRDSSFDFHPLSHESGVLTSDMICSGKNGKREDEREREREREGEAKVERPRGKPIKDHARDVVAMT